MRGRKAVFYLFVFLLVSSLSYAFNLELNSGWNLISIPVNISNKTASWLCDQVNCSSILAYNNGWISYSPNRAMNSLENINETIGIWVYTNKSDSVVVDGQLANTPIQHYSGWNLVGYPSLISRAVEEVYNMSKVEAIFMFNNTWKNVSELNPGYGYWIKALEDFTLVINNAPVIDLITILPDDSVDAGVQVMPNAGNVTEVRINVEVSDIDGVDDIALVEALTPKGLINLNKVGNIDSDTGNYSSVFYMNYSDIAGNYTIYVNASDSFAEVSSEAVFEYLEMVALELDTNAINFGNLGVLGIGNVTGDENMGTSAPTIKNTDKEILVENVKYRFDDNDYYNLSEVPFGFDLNLAINDINKIDFLLYIPESTLPGNYGGTLTITARK